MFCPKCGSILLPKKEGAKKILACSCGHKDDDLSSVSMKENLSKAKEIEVVESDFETSPMIDARCDKCGNEKAWFWTVQTRAADEPETKFFKCTGCKHIWRDYN